MSDHSRPLPLLALLLLLTPPTAGAAAPARATPGGFDPDLLAGLRARSIGPAAMSGRVTVIEGVAAEPRTLYAGAASGGVWKSGNGGLTWVTGSCSSSSSMNPSAISLSATRGGTPRLSR